MIPTSVFIHYLQRLDVMLMEIETLSPKGDNILNARLHKNMFPLWQQAKITIGFSLRACCPLANMDIASFEEEKITLTAVKKQLHKTLAFLEKIPTGNFSNYQACKVKTTAGFAKHTMLGDEYYLQYALPNFMFHLSMVYAIARAQGIPLSKGDFDGYHQYPREFSFE